jgi:hypothetical protein
MDLALRIVEILSSILNPALLDVETLWSTLITVDLAGMR